LQVIVSGVVQDLDMSSKDFPRTFFDITIDNKPSTPSLPSLF
jgi:hypothetical protein